MDNLFSTTRVTERYHVVMELVQYWYRTVRYRTDHLKKMEKNNWYDDTWKITIWMMEAKMIS